MEVTGLKLPTGFVRDVNNGKLRREIGSWQLKSDIDAFGNHLETEIGDVCETPEAISRATEDLWTYFVDESPDDEPNEWENEPGYIPYIKNFSEILQFALGGDGSPFCFDFRNDVNNPSVIWWADAYWRRIADDYESFIELFDLSENL